MNITFWYSGLKASNVDALKTITDQYNSSQTKVHVTLEFQGSYDEGASKYLTALRETQRMTCVQNLAKSGEAIQSLPQRAVASEV